MGLFSKLRGRGAPEDLNIGTAVMIPMVAAMLSDGSIDEDEVVQIRSICLVSPIFANNSRDKDTEIILRAIRMVEDEGAKITCGKAANVLSPALRETALAFAVLLVMADGHIGQKEEQLIDNLVSWLSVDGDRAEIIVEVAALFRNGPES